MAPYSSALSAECSRSPGGKSGLPHDCSCAPSTGRKIELHVRIELVANVALKK